MLKEVETMSLGQLANKYGVHHQTILNYLHDEFLRVRTALITQGETESDATMKAYMEVYKCEQTVRTIEV